MTSPLYYLVTSLASGAFRFSADSFLQNFALVLELAINQTSVQRTAKLFGLSGRSEVAATGVLGLARICPPAADGRLQFYSSFAGLLLHSVGMGHGAPLQIPEAAAHPWHTLGLNEFAATDPAQR